MNSTNKTLIECAGADFGYDGRVVLGNVNLSVPEGVFWPIVGPNGAGKSTLLRGLLGLLKPYRGSVTRNCDGYIPGYVPQGWKLDPIFPLTVGEVVLQGRFGGESWNKRPSAADKEFARESLREVRLENVWDKNYRDLSGGMKQKVLIARALAYSSPLMCLDEPTSEVDKPSEIEILEHLCRLHEEKKMTILMVCHAIGSVFDYAHACMLVERGVIELASGQKIAEVRKTYV